MLRRLLGATSSKLRAMVIEVTVGATRERWSFFHASSLDYIATSTIDSIAIEAIRNWPMRAV
jgi:hypothetical protein